MTDGLVVVDKPAGWTSHDVVARCRKIFGQKKVGHAGTLDPDATGVLLVGLGRATRLMQFVTGLSKRYTGIVVLGTATSTLDASGEVIATWDMSGVDLEAARGAASELVGEIDQIPPMVSAIKIGGQRLHELARKGIEVDRPARRVTVSRFQLSEAGGSTAGQSTAVDSVGAVDSAGPGKGSRFEFLVDCSSGTYIRTLAADLGSALGGGAYLDRLRRERVGEFTLDDAVPLDDVGPDRVLPPAAMMRGFEFVGVDAGVADEVVNGRVMDREHLGAAGAGPWPVVNADDELIAVYRERTDGRVQPVVVLA